MIAPPTPHNEEDRLAALARTGLLDTPPEERFDRYTRVARRLFDVPIALVSLVDEHRQWFKSRQGLDATQTPRDISFCGHALFFGQEFVVEDALRDPRFRDNPLVTGGPKIRFYAGSPLRSPDGHRIGTLCIIDRVPRTPGDDELQSLRDMASMVSGEIAAFQLATLDSLTGIANRRAFHLIGDPALKLCERNGGSASLLMIDLDDFKCINDTHGHAVGDEALVEFAGLLKRSFRESDVTARIGGDEFCVLLSDSKKERAMHCVERVQEALDTANAEPGRRYRLHFSFGVIDYDPSRHQSVSELLREADEKMYVRKRSKNSARGVAAG